MKRTDLDPRLVALIVSLDASAVEDERADFALGQIREFFGLSFADIADLVQDADREEARELDDHCRSLMTEDSALYGRIRR